MSTQGVTYSVNLDSAVAVYVQIENQVQFAIAAGHYKANDVLPSVRDMSSMLTVNPNTVTKSYRDLELMGLVYTRRGVGVMVSEKASKLCREPMRKLALAHLKESVAECLACGMDAATIQADVKNAIAKGVKPYQA
jgi:DNA-binding transcriptional regulator YhcF (GntR family)